MTAEEFLESLVGLGPPAGSSPALVALWHDAKGEWDTAHRVAQDVEGVDGAWVHAYLHRKEGDLSNAAYWYRRAGQPVERGSLHEEWEKIVRTLLSA